ncbi:MAG: hypothetical protein BGP11_11185 [Rhodobacterales bacterium 65-51]|nr:MAG: hypothetical protein BGP11_11185 [Rhodobacterales bacterium 65-51]
MLRHELNFLEFLQTFRRGELLAAGDGRLSELMEAIRETGQGGSLTLKFSFKVNKAGQLEITPDLSIKRPQRAIGTGIYYATDEGRLTRRDPNQLDIEDEIERRRGSDT